MLGRTLAMGAMLVACSNSAHDGGDWPYPQPSFVPGAEAMGSESVGSPSNGTVGMVTVPAPATSTPAPTLTEGAASGSGSEIPTTDMTAQPSPSDDVTTGETSSAGDDETHAPDPVSTEDAGFPPAADASTAIDDLTAYLALDRAQRPPIGEQDFALLELSKQQAEHAGRLLWQDHAAFIADTRRAEHESRAIILGDQTLRYDFTTFGEAPASGRSLYISLHGGGNAAPSVNDEQWENQKLLYQPDEGIYLAPRAPTDTWNLWHEAHIDVLFARLITNFVVLEDVNPDRIYVMGYSAGGDGVYQLGPRMADYWAAAAAMAGHPNEAQPLSLRNIGFTVHVGALDTGYDRNLVAQEWSDQLDALREADPGGYAHVVQIHAGKPHWMDLEDAVAVPWMAEFTRDSTPEHIVWFQDDVTHSTFYWLAVVAAEAGTLIKARVEGQQVEISSEDVSEVGIRLSDELLDLDQPVTVSFNGSVVHSGTVSRSIAVLARTLGEREDPRLMFSAELWTGQNL